MPRHVAVVVPCRDEAENIERCLRSLRAQDRPIDRIIVVDNGSVDGSQELAAPFAEVAPYAGTGISRVRNHGASLAPEADVIGFVDADCEVDPGWLSAGLASLDAGASIVGSRADAPDDATWVAQRWCRIEAHQAHSASLLWSQHLLLDKAVFDELGGFEESMATGEDQDLSRRVIESGRVLVREPSMRAIHHGFAPDLRTFVRRESWHTSTPGWFSLMSPKSKAVVLGTAGWAAAAPLVIGVSAARRSPRPLLTFAAASAAAIPALGYAAARSPRHVLQDGVLMWLWGLTRARHLVSEIPGRTDGRTR